MKKLLSVVIIGLLCFVTFSIPLPKVDASTEPFSFSLLWTRNTSATVQGMAVDDINCDGKNEVVYAEWTGMVYAVNSSGDVLWTFPTGWYDNIEIGDLQGDGSKEVVVASADRHVYCLNGTNGHLIWSFPTAELACHGPLTLTDINGDGKLEIVVGEWDSNVYWASPANIYVLDYTGNLMWKYTLPDDLIPSAADVNKDGIEEVFAYYGRPQLTSTGYLYAFNPDGSVKWSTGIPGCAWSLLFFADLNNDGIKEVVTYRNSDNAILIFNSTDGSLLRTIPHGYGLLVGVIDLDNDGEFEFLTWYESTSTLYALDSNGNKIWESPLSGRINTQNMVVAVDLNGDGKKEIVVGVSGMLYVLCSQGSMIWNSTVQHTVSEIEIADIDGDGLLDIVAGTANPSDQTSPEIVSVFKQLRPEVHDVAVVDVTPSTNRTYVGHPIPSVRINVTVTNEGDVPENCTVIVYADSDTTVIGDEVIVGTQHILNLTVGEYRTLTFPWDTTGVTPCHNYTITAVAVPVPHETDTADNTSSSPTLVKVKLIGDVNGDGEVDMKDVYEAAKAFGSYPNHPRWNPDADICGDNKVDMRDIWMVVTNFGTCK